MKEPVDPSKLPEFSDDKELLKYIYATKHGAAARYTGKKSGTSLLMMSKRSHGMLVVVKKMENYRLVMFGGWFHPDAHYGQSRPARG